MIARAAPGEAGTLTALAHAAKRHWGYPEEWITRWADTLTVTPEYLEAHPTHAAWEDGTCVGFCTVIIAGPDARLEHLWVLPAAMGRGVGRLLFEFAAGIARAGGATRLVVESDPHAEAFYIHLGATRFGQVPAPMDGRERFLPLLAKRLT
jgi:GNAT superfamily N-acetyltransferase